MASTDSLIAAPRRTLICVLRGEGRVTASLLLPAVVFLGLLFAYPLLTIVWRSFTEPSIGIENYVWFFTTDVNLTILNQTFVTAAAVTATCVLIGYPYAYVMLVSGKTMRSVLLLALLIPLFTSTMTRTFAWVLILQGNGVLNWMLGWIGLGPYQLLGTNFAVVLGMSHVLLPFAVLPIYANMVQIDLRLLTAAHTLGARPVVAFWKIFLPLSLPGVLAGSVVIIVTSLGFFITPSFLGRSEYVLLPVLIEVQVGRLLEWGRGGAISVILLALTFVMLGLLAYALRKNKGVFQAKGSS